YVIAETAPRPITEGEQRSGATAQISPVAQRRRATSPSGDRSPRTDRADARRGAPAETQPAPPPRHISWDHYVRGTSNQLACTTANMIASDPGRLTPVLLHGPNGCGKSHLAA